MTRLPLSEYILAAKVHYSIELPYHNWQHALDVISAVKDIIDTGTTVTDGSALYVAAAWHDAGFYEDHRALGFETKEHYAAKLAKDYLQQQGMDETFITTVEIAILGTIHGAERERIEALILHRADIANIGGEYVSFYKKNSLLFAEAKVLGSQPTWEAWTKNTQNLVQGLVEEAKQELPRLGLPTTDASFVQRATQNAERLSKETAPYTSPLKQ